MCRCGQYLNACSVCAHHPEQPDSVQSASHILCRESGPGRHRVPPECGLQGLVSGSLQLGSCCPGHRHGNRTLSAPRAGPGLREKGGLCACAPGLSLLLLLVCCGLHGCSGICSRISLWAGRAYSHRALGLGKIRLHLVMINGDPSAQEKLHLTEMSALHLHTPPRATGRRRVLLLARPQTTSRGGKQSPEI